MWPWGHLAFGYLVYSLVTRTSLRAKPEPWHVAALALGTQFPDLVDKPLAWWVGVLPGGRTLAHSLLIALPLVVVLLVIARRRGQVAYAVAFGIGYATHLVGDSLEILYYGTYDELAFLLWPATSTVVYESEPSVLWHLANIEPSGVFLAELALGAVVFGLWIADGRPFLAELLAMVRRASDDPTD